ncbi:hypothetical protein COOONC_27634, partial [Cooperia oncophora]
LLSERILGSSFASYPRRNRARVDSASAARNIPTIQSTNHPAQQPLRRGDEENEDNATPSERTRYSIESDDTQTLFDTIDILENLSRQG